MWDFFYKILTDIYNWLKGRVKPIEFLVAFVFLCIVVILLQVFNLIDLRRLIHDEWSFDQSRTTRPYSMLSLVMHIKLNDHESDGKQFRKAKFRTYYTLKGTRDISANENVFPESYTSNHVTIEQWPGSESQKSNGPQTGNFYINFDLEENEVKTIVTGADYDYPKPLVPDAISCFGPVALANNQWVWCYPNEEDFIDQITFIVEADNFDISVPINNSTFRSKADNSVTPGKAECKKLTDNGKCTIVAKWQQLAPGECVGLVINW